MWRCTPLLLYVGLASCAAAPAIGRSEPRPLAQRSHPGPLGKSAYDRIRQVNTRIGTLDLDDERWGRLDSPLVVGLDYVETVDLEWLHLEGGLTMAYDEASATIPRGPDAGDRVEESLSFFEFSAGVLLAPAPGETILRPYLGAGGSILWTDVDSIVDDELLDDDDTVLGGYAKAGLLFQVTDEMHVGVEVRWLDTDTISAGDESLPLDGMVVSFVFGASFDWFSW